MKVLLTGARGFIGRNLTVHLREADHTVLEFTRDHNVGDLGALVAEADFVFHLAGVNRPDNDAEFKRGNTDLTGDLVKAIEDSGKTLPIVISSSTHAERDTPYGTSKREAEEIVRGYGKRTGAPVHIYRLPGVFGKWSRPNYNSFVSTFCQNIARDQPIRVDNPVAPVALVYIDDVCAEFMAVLNGDRDGSTPSVSPVYQTTVGDVADTLRGFRKSRTSLVTDSVGEGLTRALYSTYLSYLPPDDFAYNIPTYSDPRGEFGEVLKTRDSGQFSYFTAHPGVTRGQHYHHSKNEKFLVLQGQARFLFKHIVTGEEHEIVTDGETKTIVETVPGWTHDITNVGDDLLICMLWANEIFDRDKPDTVAMPTR